LSAGLITKEPKSLLDELSLETAVGDAIKDPWEDSGVQEAVSWSCSLPSHDNMF
ncbi:unnamed protein product, partial [Penicillium pancosmium]